MPDFIAPITRKVGSRSPAGGPAVFQSSASLICSTQKRAPERLNPPPGLPKTLVQHHTKKANPSQGGDAKPGARLNRVAQPPKGEF